MKILVTGCAGFIGAACTQKLLQRSDTVIGIDNLNDYYEVSLKKARLSLLQENSNFHFHHSDITDQPQLFSIIKKHEPQRLLHLAAQAGVRYSIENPQSYIQSNLVGFANILEAVRTFNIEYLVFASSSSVYGGNDKLPYSIKDNVDHPLSLYAATKKSNELMAHAYSHLYKMATTGLRYFTVYGPWGRPDMAPFKFAKKIMAGEPIQVYNYGHHSRNFTYIDDIVAGTLHVLDKVLSDDNVVPYGIYNIGYGQPSSLLTFIELLEKALGRTAIKEMAPKQPGDVDNTWADTKELKRDFSYEPQISLEAGIAKFAKWFLEFHN